MGQARGFGSHKWTMDRSALHTPIYRFYELVSVYGTTFKELTHEEFGDGINDQPVLDADRLFHWPLERRANGVRPVSSKTTQHPANL